MSDEIMLVFGEDGVAREYDDTWDITIHCESEEEQKVVLEKLNIENVPSAQPESEERKAESAQNVPKEDLISRKAAIDAVDSETVSTNPEHFKSSEKFIKFMDDADISSFGKWQWSNGFNTAVVAAKVQLEKLPSAQPEIVRCKDCKYRGGLSGCYCDIVEKMVGVDSFCSWAERRTDEPD